MKLSELVFILILLLFRSAAFAQQTGDSCVNTADCTLPPIHLAADSALVQAEEIQQEISALDLADLPRKEHPDFWLNRIKAGSYDIKDSTIIYPKFPALCVKIYNWADRTLNTYDHDYVMPTGKKWKVMWKGSFWSDSYALDIPDNVHIRMLSSLYMSSGPYVSFMALTVGYAANLNRLISHVPARQKRFDFSFSTALFEVDLYYTRNRDGTVIRRFEPYDQGKLLHVEFPSLQLENWGVAAFYFLNNRRYYQGAAFNYSKIQKRSQGSFIFGLAYSHNKIDFDLGTLPQEMIDVLPADARLHFRFVNYDICAIGGYGYNWVFNPHWVFNITGMPAFGLKHCTSDNGDGRKNLPAINLSARGGLAYNLRNFFVGVYGSINSNWYLNSNESFINAIGSFGFAVGLRF